MVGLPKSDIALSRPDGTIINDSEPQSFRLWTIDLGYAGLWCAMMLWAKLDPGSFRFSSGGMSSPISQVMGACATLTPLFIPFVVYYPIAAGKWRLKSFSSLAQLRVGQLYLKPVLTCFLLTLTPLLSVYLLFSLMVQLDPTNDLVPSVPAWFFLTFIVFLSLLLSLTSVGLAMSNNRISHLIAIVLATSAVVLPFVLSELVTGRSFLSQAVKFIQAVQASTILTLLPLLLSILLGSVFLLQSRIRQL